jgi:hypothetical protein
MVLAAAWIAAAWIAGFGCSSQPSPELSIWYSLHQQVGHLGHAQDDFNLLGHVQASEGIAALTYRLNGAAPETLTVGQGPFGDGRRLGARGDFNADIPLDRLRLGANTVVLTATDPTGAEATARVRVDRREGDGYALPAAIDWAQVDDVQDVGQVVDGKWGLSEAGLRTLETGYDRIFLIGDTTWQDYEVTVPVTIHRVDAKTGPRSGANGLGILMRFTGHAVGTYRDWPADQPTWGYQPFGAIGWLRWNDGAESPPYRQFYHGDYNTMDNFGTFPIQEGQTYWMTMRAETLPDTNEGRGVTRYAWKAWPDGQDEPAAWAFEVTQTSEHALRRGGMVLLAHHVDATFGNVRIRSLDDPE